MVINKSFPFLILEIFWYDIGKLKFQFHRKKNQLFNYLNEESTHIKSTFKSIPNGVLNRLDKLILIIEDNSKTIINECYANKDVSLAEAGLNMKIFQL